MLVEASLSYLGYGVQPPDVSWGLMVAENQADFVHAWWTVVFPGLSLALTVVAINLFANWLRALTDPRQRELRLAPRRREIRVASLDADDSPASIAAGRTPLLEVRNMDAVFETPTGPVPAVRGMTFSIAPGETVGIVGESGSGKSSTALALLGLIAPPGHVSGTFRWKGRDVTHAQLTALRGSEITMIFQDPMTSLNPLVPVGRQVAEVLRFHKKMSWRAARQRALELFELVGIPSAKERLGQYPYQLSGGLRQRVMIACALAPDPKLIVADEPTTALDVTIQAQILEVIAEIRTRLDVAMLLITHDLGVVAGECDRVIVMYGGRLVEEASTEELFASPRHRYTQALLAASPRIDATRDGRLTTIPGQPPTRISAGPGCPFAPRCAFATEECSVMPPMTWVAPGERFACWHPAEEVVR
jgi:oligopeptide/dipeptide ABC transporter ATP-binding protein